MREKTNPNIKAALIPADEAESPPVKIPIAPSRSIASFTPLPIVAPKPVSGSEAPHPKYSSIGSYSPVAKRIPMPLYYLGTRIKRQQLKLLRIVVLLLQMNLKYIKTSSFSVFNKKSKNYTKCIVLVFFSL